jgi:hypothetical protein
MVADTLTKALPQVAFDRHARHMGLHSTLKGKELEISHPMADPPLSERHQDNDACLVSLLDW